MDMRMVTLENGWSAVVTERQAAAMSGAGQGGFAAELERVAARAEASGDTDFKTAYDRLSDGSKTVLSRLKSGEADVSKSEWFDLRKELRDLGLITQNEFFDSDPDIVVLGYTDGNGDFVEYPSRGGALAPGLENAHFLVGGASAYVSGGVRYGRYWTLEEWSGDPFQSIDAWLEAIRGWRDDLDQLVREDGTRYDTSSLTRQIEAKEKVNGLVRDLMKVC